MMRKMVFLVIAGVIGVASRAIMEDMIFRINRGLSSMGVS